VVESCHVGSADGGLVPESKLIFRSKSESNTDYHGKMNAELFMKLFQEQFLLSLAPECNSYR
jgi:hypothetical protein